MRKLATLSMLLLALAAPEQVQAQLGTTNAFPNLTFSSPTDIQAPPDGTNRLFVVEQAGTIRVFPNDPTTTTADVTVFLDIQSLVTSGGELGLLGLAFHPNYASNGLFYVNYTAGSPLRTVVSQFSVSGADPDVADDTSELILLEVTQPDSNHNGGQLQFGDDGFLYIALGDGGGSGDPNENGEDPTNLLGTILRIDVEGAGGGKQGSSSVAPDCGSGTNYTIPADNPFVGDPLNPDYCDEIWAYGLRNPWRFSFDTNGEDIWVADVGQDDWEEIDLIKASLVKTSPDSTNYGWDIFEGNNCHEPPMAGCDMTDLMGPVWEYAHDPGHSITGGYVYDGFLCSELSGKYVYGDYESGELWSLEVTATDTTATLEVASGLAISTFGVDQNDELYIADYGGSGTIHTFSNCTPLPVELISFEAVADGPDALLTWTTASETNNAGFEIHSQFGEPGLENGDWTVIGFVEGAGTTLESQSYTFRVEDVAPGRHLFRLKQIDFDGTFEYSPQVEVVIEPTGAYYLSDAYPNPFNPATRFTLTLVRDQHVRVEVYSVLGRRVAVLHDGPLAANITHVFTFKAGTLPSGLYLYRVTGMTFTASKQVMRLK